MDVISENLLLKILETLVNQIPPGKVTTYSKLAEALGDKIARKFVYFALKKVKGPTWRVINERVEIKDLNQILKLKEEGIKIEDLRKNLKKYLFEDFKVDFKPLEYLRKIQRDLVSKIVLEDKLDKVEIIGGVDLSYNGNIAHVVVVYLDKNLNLIKYAHQKVEVDFPYIPSFLAFREGPAAIKVLKENEIPDILFVNGHGIAHPVKLGLATYVGVNLDIPTIGITKKLLVGKVVDNKIILNNEQVGWVIEKFGKKVYVSPGHRVSLETSKILSEKYWIKGNYPEPIRLADEISKRVKRI